jgi:hypothetical protein
MNHSVLVVGKLINDPFTSVESGSDLERNPFMMENDRAICIQLDGQSNCS